MGYITVIYHQPIEVDFHQIIHQSTRFPVPTSHINIYLLIYNPFIGPGPLPLWFLERGQIHVKYNIYALVQAASFPSSTIPTFICIILTFSHPLRPPIFFLVPGRSIKSPEYLKWPVLYHSASRSVQ